MRGSSPHTRLALAFYCIGSLDLLGVLEDQISAKDRQLWQEWLWQQYARRAHLILSPSPTTNLLTSHL